MKKINQLFKSLQFSEPILILLQLLVTDIKKLKSIISFDTKFTSFTKQIRMLITFFL